MFRLLRFSFFVLITVMPGLLVSGQVKFTTVASSQEIGKGEYLQIEFVIENAKQIDELTPPDFQGFQVVQGPIQSSGMSIVNGNMSQYKSLSFVLEPTKTGKFTIGGASAQVDGKQMHSNPITITVTASSTSGNSNKNNNPPPSPFPQFSWPADPSGTQPGEVDREYMLKPGDNINDKIRKNLFVRLQVDKTTCYVGEPIVATYKLYSRLSSESRVTKRPSLNGFSVYDMIDPAMDAVSVEKINGKAFTVHTIRKTQLIPLQAGDISLDPVEVENTVHFIKSSRQERRSGSGNPLKDLFDQLADDNPTGPEVQQNITLDSKPVTITVKPLPETGRPDDFNGAVGNFSIQAVLKTPTVAAQDENDILVTVKGKGNLPVITAPKVQWPSGMENFDPTAKDDINKTTVPMSGSKTFDYLFTPDAPGHYVIPAITFSYFDPVSQSYKRAGTDSLEVEVTAAVKKAHSTTTISPSVATPAAGAGWKNALEQHLEWIFAVLILSGLAIYLWRQNKSLKKAEQEKLEAEKKAAEELMAEKQRRQTNPSSYGPMVTVPPQDPLLETRQLFAEGDYKGFYRELNRAVWKAIADKLDLPASELNKHNITRQLEARGWGMDTILSLENILNECEMNLYTPAYDAHNMQQLLWQAESLLARL